ncbi:MAG: ABC transporter permease [Gammaproteobacteria bacterium]|nr:ABC transporter permease [Gammaproteobacteria bacterium]
MNVWQLPRIRKNAFAIWHRNLLVWKRLIGPAMVLNFGEPTLYLLGLGFGLGFFIGEMGDMPYIAFLASGIVASSAMTTASFEGMYSVFTRMVPQRTYEAIMATPTDIDDILAGEMLWCATKSLISAVAILIVAFFLDVVHGWQVIFVIPVVFLIGLCFAGPAIVMSSLASNYDFFNYYFVLVITPMFIVSGVFYPVSTLPELMQTAVQFLPLPHAVALTRPLVTGQELTQPVLHLTVLAVYAVVSYYIAVVMVRKKLLI